MIDRSQAQIHAFIQAGGRSSRTGTDKAWLEINGRPMIESVLSAAHPVAASLSIIINSANPNAELYSNLAAKWSARLLYDQHDHKGPLGGIHTALKNCGEGEAALILACDLPFITTEFLSFLCRLHRNPQSTIRNPPAVIVPMDQENRLQPLVAVYDHACLPAIESMIAEGQLKVDRLFEQVQTQFISFDEATEFSATTGLFSNINSLEDYTPIIT